MLVFGVTFYPWTLAHILLGRLWLYDLDVTSFEKSNTYTFLFNGKEIVLTPSPHKSQTNNQKNRSITDKKTRNHSILPVRVMS